MRVMVAAALLYTFTVHAIIIIDALRIYWYRIFFQAGC